MRNSSSLDWLRFMHTPNDYRVSQDKPMNILIIPNYVSQMPTLLAIFLIKIQKSIYPILQSP